MEPFLLIHHRRRPVTHKYIAKGEEDKPDGNERVWYREDGEAVRCRLEGMVVLESVNGQPGLHGRQDDGDEHSRRRQPRKAVLKEASVLVPVRHVTTQERVLREAVYLVQTAETELLMAAAASCAG